MITENKGDYVVTSVPSGFSDNRLQQQRVISQTIELKDGNTIPSAQQAFVAQPTTTYQTDFKPNYGTQDFTSKNNTQDYTKITKTETADTGIANFGRTVPYSFNVEEDKKFESKVDSSKFAPNEDGKSSPDFLAFLNQIKSGSGSSGYQFINIDSTPHRL